MRVLLLPVIISALISGCTPASVSLNADFGFSQGNLEKAPVETIDDSQFFTVTQTPTLINSSTQNRVLLGGTCSNAKKIILKVNNANNFAQWTCSALWSATVDLSSELDGKITLEFLNGDTNTVLKKIEIEKDTVAPVASLVLAPAPLNNITDLSLNVILPVDSFYSYKINLTGIPNCQDPSGYSAYAEASTPLTHTLTSDLDITLCLIGKDRFGNEQLYANASSFSWTRDTDAPTTDLLALENDDYINSTNKTNFRVYAACTEIGRTVQIKAKRIGSGEVVESGPCAVDNTIDKHFDLSSLSDGTVDFYIMQTDAAGNVADENVATLVKDTTPPSLIGAIGIEAFSPYLNRSPNITWDQATDSGSSIFEYKIGLGTQQNEVNVVSYVSRGLNLNHTFLGLNLTEGTPYFVTIKVFDHAGNYAEISPSASFRPDTIGPNIVSIDDGTASAAGATPLITWQLNPELGPDLLYFQYAIGTTAGTSNVIGWTNTSGASVQLSNVIFTLGNTYYASVRAVDSLGNVGAVKMGNGFKIQTLVTEIYSNDSAFVGKTTTGHLVGWGESGCGATIPSILKNGALTVVNIVSTPCAFAALMNDGSVIAWGSASTGGDMGAKASSLNGTIDVTSIIANKYAFAALRSDGSVVAWGDSARGGDIGGTAAGLAIVSLAATDTAFAAITNSGSVIAWGNASFGGYIDGTKAPSLDGTTIATQARKIVSTSAAFAAIRRDDTVITWGDASYGGDSSFVTLTAITDVFSSASAFAALKSTGGLVTWGASSYGGNSSTVSVALSGATSPIAKVFSNLKVMAALRADKSVITWGHASSGASYSPSGTLTNVESLTATDFAFAALKSNGSVVAFGDPASGGSIPSPRMIELNGTKPVTQLQSAQNAFAALRNDGSVIAWGAAYDGGETDGAASLLTGANSAIKLYSTKTAFAARMADGTVVSWGNPSTGGDSSSINVPDVL